jgi:hypothetical protein
MAGKFFTKYPCALCGKPITNAGLGHTAHLRMHERAGLMREISDKSGGGALTWKVTEQGKEFARTHTGQAPEFA